MFYLVFGEIYLLYFIQICFPVWKINNDILIFLQQYTEYHMQEIYSANSYPERRIKMNDN